MERIPIKSQPHLFDKPIGQLQRQIGEKIDWLDHVFGLAETVTELKEGRRYKMATTYIGGEEYEQIAPCEELGNFCFFVLKDPQERVNNFKSLISAPFYAVFWYNVKNVSSSVDERNREALKDEILAVLNSIHSPHIEWGRIYENPDAIFSDFSYDITDNQYLMSPYAGLKIEGRLTARVSCIEDFKAKCGSFNESFNESYDHKCKDGYDFNDDFNEDFDSEGMSEKRGSFSRAYDDSYDKDGKEKETKDI